MAATRNAILILVLTFSTFTYGKKHTCPPEEDMIEGCTCDWLKGVTCSQIMNPHSLFMIMDKFSKYTFSSFKLTDSFLLYLPKAMFRKAPIETLTIQNCEILGWETEDSSAMFEGAEDSLTTIQLYEVTGIVTWRWSVFSALNRLENFIVNRAEVGEIGESFSMPKQLRKLYLNKANIKYLHPEAFAKHEELDTISLEMNNLEEIKRSMFPKPAKKLQQILLVDNKLKYLPDDIFTEMPELKVISIVNNLIQRLSEETFAPVIKQDWVVYMESNDLYCCTDMEWIVEKDYKNHFIGTCNHPQLLQGKKIGQLGKTDFSHGLC